MLVLLVYVCFKHNKHFQLIIIKYSLFLFKVLSYDKY